MIYLFPAEVTKVYDGDTITVNVDLGFHVILHKRSMRISDVDTPEIRSKDLLEKEAAKAVRDLVRELLPERVMIRSESLDKYGRILGDVRSDGAAGLSAFLKFYELGREYKGKARPKWTKKQLKGIIERVPRMLEKVGQLRSSWI